MKHTRLSRRGSINREKARPSSRAGRGHPSSALLFMGWLLLLPSLLLAIIGIGPLIGPSGEGVTIGFLFFGASLIGGLIGAFLLLAASLFDRRHQEATEVAPAPARRKPSPPTGLCTACGIASSRHYCDNCAREINLELYENLAHNG